MTLTLTLIQLVQVRILVQWGLGRTRRYWLLELSSDYHVVPEGLGEIWTSLYIKGSIIIFAFVRRVDG